VFFVQKYFECGTGQQVMLMFHKILPETRKLTMNKYGSRVVQTAFSYVTQEQHTEWTKVNTLKRGTAWTKYLLRHQNLNVVFTGV
jgi:hypothetical protein